MIKVNRFPVALHCLLAREGCDAAGVKLTWFIEMRRNSNSAKGIAMLFRLAQSRLSRSVGQYVACCSLLLTLGGISSVVSAGERPTFNKDTCDPRPDILPYWLTSWHTDYRQRYNRPRYIGGKLAYYIEPTSQEAMVWCEANNMGLYKTCNHPPVYKQYNSPKPWEILQTGPRPDFAKAQGNSPSSSGYDQATSGQNMTEQGGAEQGRASDPNSPAKSESRPSDQSPSDRSGSGLSAENRPIGVEALPSAVSSRQSSIHQDARVRAAQNVFLGPIK